MKSELERAVEYFQPMETAKLAAIWVANDHDAWTEFAFDAIARTLAERGEVLPPQGPLHERRETMYPRPAFMEPRPYTRRIRRLLIYETALCGAMLLWFALGLAGLL